MTRPLAAHTIAWTDQVAAAVRDHATTQPASTHAIADLLGINPYANGGMRLWRALDRLARAGRVRRIKDPEAACRLWQWTGGPDGDG